MITEDDDVQRARQMQGTVVDEERGHESAGGERDVEADEHVGEARREDGLPEVLRPAVPDGRPGGGLDMGSVSPSVLRAHPLFGALKGARWSSVVVEDAVGEPVHRTG